MRLKYSFLKIQQFWILFPGLKSSSVCRRGLKRNFVSYVLPSLFTKEEEKYQRKCLDYRVNFSLDRFIKFNVRSSRVHLLYLKV